MPDPPRRHNLLVDLFTRATPDEQRFHGGAPVMVGKQVSSRYPGGVALRFARVLRYRPDKNASDADTIDAVRALLTISVSGGNLLSP